METKCQGNDENSVGETRRRNRGVHNADEHARSVTSYREENNHIGVTLRVIDVFNLNYLTCGADVASFHRGVGMIVIVIVSYTNYE
jgi:hypothetical protein